MFLQQLINGLTIGSIYALVTIGFSMVWSILQLANFAHGSFYMLGPYLVLTSVLLLGNTPLTFIVVVLIISIFTACLGAGMDRVLLRPIREKKVSNISTILCTIGVQTVINNGIIAIYGSQSRAFPAPFEMETIAAMRMIQSRTGRAISAIKSDQLVADVMGINVKQVKTLVFIIASAIAGLAGGFYAHYISFIDPTSFNYNKSIQIMSMAILGGMGSIPGSIIGAIVLTALPELLRDFVLLRQVLYGVVIIIMVLFRPAGLLGGINFKHILQKLNFKNEVKKDVMTQGGTSGE